MNSPYRTASKEDFCWLLNIRQELPAKWFSEPQREEYRKNLNKLFHEMRREPPFHPGEIVVCNIGLDEPRVKARVMGSYFDLYEYPGSGGHENLLTVIEDKLVSYGWAAASRNLYTYSVRYDVERVEKRWEYRIAWWSHGELAHYNPRLPNAIPYFRNFPQNY